MKQTKDLLPGEQVQWGKMLTIQRTLDDFVVLYYGANEISRLPFSTHPDVTGDYTGVFGSGGKIRNDL
jgi:hypothetical protein